MKSKLSMISLGTALLVTLILTGCATAGGKSTARVTTEKKYIRLDHVRDTAEQANLQGGDAIAMACSKCTTVWSSQVQELRPRIYNSYREWGTAFQRNRQLASSVDPFVVSVGRHFCPGCKSTITTTGHGKHKQEMIKHTCENCGDNSMLCCATRRDAPPTDGMEKKASARPIFQAAAESGFPWGLNYRHEPLGSPWGIR